VKVERARQYGITYAMPTEAWIASFVPHPGAVSFDIVHIPLRDATRSAVVEAQICTLQHPSGPTMVSWLHDTGFAEVHPTHSGAHFAARLFATLERETCPTDLQGVEALLRPIIQLIVQLPAPPETDPMITAFKGTPGGNERCRMDLHLAVVTSGSDAGYQVRMWDSDVHLAARPSGPMVDHGIAVRPRHLVALDRSAELPRIVYRRSDIALDSEQDGYSLKQKRARVDPEQLRATGFPRIRATYAGMQ
jgi:hypothetical protein